MVNQLYFISTISRRRMEIFFKHRIYFSDPRSLNHEVTLVGYGEKEGETFWIIRNSWGPHWGIDGYMHIASRENACGITTEPTYVVF